MRDVILWNTGPSGKDVHEFNLYRTLGAYKIAHSVRKAGYSAQVIDHYMRMTEDQLYACTRKFVDNDTVAIGISTTFAMGQEVHQLCDSAVNTLNRLKEEFPKLNIVFGGYNINSLKFEKQLKAKSVHAIINYGEDIFLDLIKYFKKQGPSLQSNLVVHGKRHMLVYNKPVEEKYNIEVDDFKFTDQDCIMPGETLPIEISRGCIFKCKFCNHLMLGRPKLDYLRNFELVEEEMLNNYNKWGVTNYYIICDTFNDTEIKMKAWQQMVNRLPFKINYTAYLRADLLDKFPDVPYILAETGLLSAFHGLETLGVESSKIIGKGWSGKSAKEYIPKLYHDIWQDKVHQTLSFIIGLPGDTRETFTDTISWFKSNNLYQMATHPLGIRHNRINRNPSEFDRDAEKYGYRFPNKQWPHQWETDYWALSDVILFAADMNKSLGKDTARYGSWNILQLLQYGVDENKFKKQLTWNRDMSPSVHAIPAKKYLTDYINKLLELKD
jgi:hypothetical protein